MTCTTHQAPDPCPFCAWAASEDRVKVSAAASRARRVAAGLYSEPPKSSPVEPTPTVAELVRSAVAAKVCPARVGCGCGGLACRVREMAPVTLEDCRTCLETKTPTALPPRDRGRLL
jgi:hypothetical protein